MSYILKQVNKVYRKQNPSSYIVVSKRNINNLIKSREKLLFNLKFPKKMFYKSDLIDLGSGSGLYTLVYNQFGANCTLVEYEKKFCLGAKKLFKKFSKAKFKIIQSDIFKIKIKKKFDIVTCNAVAHHTKKPGKILNIACSLVKKKGYLIWGIGNKSGFLQRAIQRIILYNIANNEKDIIKYSKILFTKHLNRASKFGGRSINQIIYDTYINPKINNQSIEEVIKIIKKNGLNLYSTYPQINTLNNILGKSDTQYKNQNIKEKINKNNKEVFLSEHKWISLTKDLKVSRSIIKKTNQIEKLKNKISSKLNNKNFNNHKINYDDLISKIKKYNKNLFFFNKIKILDVNYQNKFFKELSMLFLLIKNNNLNKENKLKKIKLLLNKSKFILKEKCGVGMTYFVATKN